MAGCTDRELDPYDCPEDADCIPGTDRCPDSCYKNRYVFLSSVPWRGYELEGSNGADEKCNRLAAIAGLFTEDVILKKPMRAWISDDGDYFIDGFPLGKGKYFLPNLSNESQDDSKLLVFEKIEFPINNPLIRRIDRDEFGNTILGGYAWTNTNLNGSIVKGTAEFTCNHWKSGCCENCPCDKGLVGEITQTDQQWTKISGDENFISCFEIARIYCFERAWEL